MQSEYTDFQHAETIKTTVVKRIRRYSHRHHYSHVTTSNHGNYAASIKSLPEKLLDTPNALSSDNKSKSIERLDGKSRTGTRVTSYTVWRARPQPYESNSNKHLPAMHLKLKVLPLNKVTKPTFTRIDSSSKLNKDEHGQNNIGLKIEKQKHSKNHLFGGCSPGCCLMFGLCLSLVLAAIGAILVILFVPKTVNTPTTVVTLAVWPLDDNTLDLYSDFDGNPIGNPGYTTSFLGFGAAINLVQSSSQFVFITSKQLPMYSRSFTIEAWIYFNGVASTDYGIFGQCRSTYPINENLCFQFMIRNKQLYCTIYNNSIQGARTLTTNRWIHVACMYDMSSQTQSVWLNGVLDRSGLARDYQEMLGATTIGAVYNTSSTIAFNGFIDHVRYESRSKNSTEILDDATLYIYYSFDNSSLIDNTTLIDSGPNGINGTAIGNLTITTGKVNQCIQLDSGGYVYYSYASFYFLGISNYPFSILLWAKPIGSFKASTIVHVHSPSSWCIHFLVINSSGRLSAQLWNGGSIKVDGPILPLNNWTHIGYTFSSTNGIQLYINGTVYAAKDNITYSAANSPVYIAIGSDNGRTSCSPGYGGHFTGLLDEFYLYSRELASSEILKLSNV